MTGGLFNKLYYNLHITPLAKLALISKKDQIFKEKSCTYLKESNPISFLKGGRQSCQFSKPQQEIDLSSLRIISQQKFLVGALLMT